MRPWLLVMLLVSVSFWTSCTKAPATVILPDSHELRPVIVCPEGMTCAVDPTRYTIDGGYLREILIQLDRCGQEPT